MSMSTDAPAGVTGGDATQQAGGGDSIAQPAADALAGTPGTGDASSQDYLGRIRAGGDFAAQEVRQHQSRADKMEAEVRRLSESTGGDSGPIRELLAQGIAPETVKVVFDNYLRLRNDPQTQEMILGFEQTGTVSNRSSSASDDEEEYLSEEQKEIRQLRTELRTMKQAQTGLTQSTGTAALQQHLEHFSKDNFLKPEEFDALKTGMVSHVKQWGSNEQGLGLLRSMQDPSSYDTVEALAWKFLPKEIRFQLGDRKRLHDREKVEGFRTDSPADTSTTGKELPAEVKGALNALQFAKANPDKI